MAKRRAVKVIVVSMLAVGFVSLVIFLYLRDDPLGDHSDLAVKPLDLEEGGEAFEAWMVAARRADLDSWNEHASDPDFHKQLNGKLPWDPERFEKILDANRDSIESAFHADTLGPFTLPRMAQVDDITPNLTDLGTVSKNLRLHALERNTAGDKEAVTETLSVALRLGDRLVEGNNSLIAFLVGATCQSSAFRAVDQYIWDLPNDQLDLLERVLAKEPRITESLERSVRIEFGFMEDTVRRLKDGEMGNTDFSLLEGSPPPRLLFRPNRTVNNSADLYRLVIADVGTEATSRKGPPKLTAPTGLKRYHSNAFGDYLIRLGTPVIWTMMNQADLSAAHRRALRLKIALVKYHRAEGGLPDELSTLVPDHLDGVPLDPFDGAPFRYDPEQGIIWAIGEDLMDYGGESDRNEAGFARFNEDPTLFVLPEE